MVSIRIRGCFSHSSTRKMSSTGSLTACCRGNGGQHILFVENKMRFFDINDLLLIMTPSADRIMTPLSFMCRVPFKGFRDDPTDLSDANVPHA